MHDRALNLTGAMAFAAFWLAAWLYLVQTGGSTRLPRGAAWVCLGVLTVAALEFIGRGMVNLECQIMECLEGVEV